MSQRPGAAHGHHVALDAIDEAPEVQEARRLLAARNPEGAIQILEPLMAQESDDYLVFEVLGVAYAQKGNITAAVGAFETAASMNPATPYTHYNLAQILLISGDKDEAKHEFEQALKVDPTYTKARDALTALLHPPAEQPAAEGGVPQGAPAAGAGQPH